MEGLQKLFTRSSSEPEPDYPAMLAFRISSGFQKAKEFVFSSPSSSAAAPSPPPPPPELPPLVLTRPPRNAVSVLTCSKLCAIFFVAGVVVGYTLKRRVRGWAAKLLRRVKDE